MFCDDKCDGVIHEKRKRNVPLCFRRETVFTILCVFMYAEKPMETHVRNKRKQEIQITKNNNRRR